MPQPTGFVNFSAGELTSAAGGDPWQVNDELQAGDADAINAQADAYHAAAGCVAEVEDDFVSAKQRFEKGWRRNGTEHPINDSPEATQAAATMNLQKPQLAKIAVDLEDVAAALATAQRTSDGDIAGLDNLLHGIDDAISRAKADKQDPQHLHDTAVAAVRTTLGSVQGIRNTYVGTMASAEAAMNAVTGQAPAAAPGGEPDAGKPSEEGKPPTVTKGDVAITAAGAVAGGTADGVRQTTLRLIDQSPGTGPGKADPGLLKWLEDPKIGGVELKGFSRVGGLTAAASAVPAVLSDVHDGNSVPEAVTREGAGTAAGLYAGAVGGGFVADLVAGGAIGSVIPGAGTAVGLVVGAGVGAATALGASKAVEWAWNPVSDAVGSAVHGVESLFGSG
ncbi:hypothetical protein [Mycobacterium sp. AT1]|uniref:putative alpha/beta hydrolase n=1 Tax=Mycobacterium sp. AT1 TaxID=1961706 RepID=UPI0009C5AC0D|nr:hypothetical protein [Mycobacterium sp. AT1]OPX07750.1 hypothetical protein B1790_21925 [Mycobacterium sp. AT1]